MAKPKIKGTGGFGQWDTGTANQDIRASVPQSPRASGGGDTMPSGPGYTTPLAPGDKGYVPLRNSGRNNRRTQRKPARSSGRKTR